MIRIVFLVALLAPIAASAAGYLPEGYLGFCRHNPSLCAEKDGAEPAIEDLATVNRSVNAAIRYRDDQPVIVGWATQGGVRVKPIEVSDIWSVFPHQGDCEDYAATKLAELLRMGVGRQYLRLALTKVDGIGHTILLAKTSRGWLALDNRYSDIRKANQYRILATETALGREWQ